MPELAKQQLSDHDLLVTLNVKFTDMASDIKELKDGTSVRLAEHETRIRATEKTLEEANLKTAFDTFYADHRWIEKFKTTWKLTVALISIVTGTLGFVLGSVRQIRELLGN